MIYSGGGAGRQFARRYVTWYHNWARLVLLGILPLTALVLLNTRIYQVLLLLLLLLLLVVLVVLVVVLMVLVLVLVLIVVKEVKWINRIPRKLSTCAHLSPFHCEP